jgi:hypothetical protein
MIMQLSGTWITLEWGFPAEEAPQNESLSAFPPSSVNKGP